jgi:chorismate mutase
MKTKVELWPKLETGKPLVIAGPCSAETEEQLINTAKELAKDERVGYLRAGIWKPRTRAGGFEGVGEPGIEWLQSARAETGLPVATEVANPSHLEKVLKANIDLIWIGARTAANPFAVQEIADALKGSNIPVLVKNPINPDVKLWIGAIERIQKAGIERVGAIHRGVSQFEKSLYRNPPEWRIPLLLREEFPDMLLINDPSHIAGNRELIFKVAQKALNLNFDGLMIESHITPEKAWSDADQQLTPSELSLVMTRLIQRKENPAETSNEDLNELRKIISHIDEEFLEMMAHRLEVASRIAEIKKDNNMTVYQKTRWLKMTKHYQKRARELDMPENFVSNLFHEIHEASINRQLSTINLSE